MKEADSSHTRHEGFKPGLTVVVPVYNRADKVKEMVESVMSQKRLPEALVLVDDHSSDGTFEVLRELASRECPFKVTVLTNRSKGATSARNTGLETVETEWTMFFDSDDIMMPEHIDAAMKTAEQHPHADIIGWDVEREDLGSRNRRVLAFDTSDLDWHNIMHGNFATQRYMAKTELFRRVGGWNENQPIWNDIELGARLLAAKPKVVKSDSVSGRNVVIRASEESITGRTWCSRYDDYLRACDNLRAIVGQSNESMIGLKMAILAGDMAREDRQKGAQFYSQIARRDFRRWLAYRLRLSGVRGIARILRLLYKISPQEN